VAGFLRFADPNLSKMKFMPFLLIYARLFTGFLLIFLSSLQVAHYEALAIMLLIFGLLTDVFDGIVARRLGISTEKLRMMDSTVDVCFFVCIGIATFLQHPAFFEVHFWELALLLAAEILTYVFCWIRFGRAVATHSIGAKIWTLFLVAALIEIIACGESGILFACCFWLGLLTRLEIIAIICVLRQWTSDVPTLYHALQVRRGHAIKRNKWFNG
jgi:phosphatidylglycerophosphate synthase